MARRAEMAHLRPILTKGADPATEMPAVALLMKV